MHIMVIIFLCVLCVIVYISISFQVECIFNGSIIGNILVRVNEKGNPVLGFLDCGIVYRTSR